MEQESELELHYNDLYEKCEFNEEQRLEGMCRVCASAESNLIPIFDDVGQSNGIVDLINNHLPILVTPNDLLPVSVCSSCLETLSSIHSLVDICVKSDEKMRHILKDAILGFSEQLNSYDVSLTDVNDLPAPLESNFVRQVKEKDQPKPENQAIASKPESPNVKGSGEKKLYRCLYCTLTDSDAYFLLLHQMKSHPGKLLKCKDCDFVYSADQRNKYNEHLKLHSLDTKDSTNSATYVDSSEASAPSFGPGISKESLQQREKAVPVKSSNTSSFEKGASVSEVKVGMKKISQYRDPVPDMSKEKKATNSSSKKVSKTEVHWRCGFCGMKAKSKTGLIEHCNQRHKERVGPSFSTSGALECSRCKQTFQSEIWLKDHLCHSIFLPKAITSTKPLSCLSCPEVFTDMGQFREHLMSHTNSVKCNICGAHFRSELNLQTHMDKHENKPTFQCSHCPRSFRLRSRMKIHLRTHTGERPYMCVKCGKRFSTDSGFRLHMAAHEGKKPYICSLCGQTFNRPSNLRRHEGICGGNKLQCRFCKEKFPSREELHCHRAMHSKEERDSEQYLQIDEGISKEDRFSCKVCGMKFDRVVELSQHRQESHTALEIEAAKKAGQVDGGAYVCPECGKEVYSKKNYDRHMLLHSGNTQFKCDECSNIYSTKFALEYHMYTHTGERPFKCDLCPEGFKTRISLKIHRMKHTGEKPFKCRLCSMGFLTAASLRLHLVSHSDSRMFSCSFCPATFKRKKTLVTHVRIHTGEKPYACKYCGRRFTQKGSCSQHEKSHTESKTPRKVDGVLNDMHVTVIKNWRDEVIESFPEDEASRIDILVSQEDSNASQCEEVQHMVLIQQDVDCVIGEPDLMEISEDMVLGNKHTIVIEQDGMLVNAPMSGLKDANSDPQMPVLDE